MKKNIIIVLLFSVVLTAINSCKKEDGSGSEKIDLQQLGNNNIKPKDGIKGFNHIGNPIILHELNVLYEYDESSNTFKKLGNVIPNPAGSATAKIVQDGLGDYYYLSSVQGEVFVLNKTTNNWDTVLVAPGYKNQMIANANGDILVYLDNSTIGGVESFYKKSANASNWVKVVDMPANNPKVMVPQFLSNAGLAFFTEPSFPNNALDGEGIYNEVVLNTNTGTFSTLYDKTDPDNFPATIGYNYIAFSCNYVSPDGTFYALVPGQIATKTELYKISSSTIPSKFVKVSDYNHPPLESGSYITMRGCKVNEATGSVKFRSSCQLGSSSHKNLGTTSTSSSELKVLQHDGPQNQLYSSPNGNVYVYNFEGFIYKWK